MADSGGIRQDIGADQHITPLENRTLRFAAEDADGDAIVGSSGWEVDFFWVESFTTGDGITLLTEDADFVRTEADGSNPIDLDVEPNIDVPIVPGDWTATMLARRPQAYELWRTDTDNVRRIAYGTIAVEH